MIKDEINKLPPLEQDFIIEGAKLCDWLRDLLLLSGHDIKYDETYQDLRLYFGKTIYELIKFGKHL